MGSNMPKEILDAMKVAKKSSPSPIKIWKSPEAGRTYIIGADPGLGNADGGRSAIEVIDAETGEQCAEYAGYVGPVALAPMILELAKLYNSAEVAVEVNSFGMVTNNLLIRKFEYENIYRYKHLDRVNHSMTDIMGWWTNAKTMRQMTAVFVETVTKTPRLIRSQKLMEEILNYEEDGFAHNDRLMAFMIALAVRGEKLTAVAA